MQLHLLYITLSKCVYVLFNSLSQHKISEQAIYFKCLQNNHSVLFCFVFWMIFCLFFKWYLSTWKTPGGLSTIKMNSN